MQNSFFERKHSLPNQVLVVKDDMKLLLISTYDPGKDGVNCFSLLLKKLKGKMSHVSRKFAESNDTNAGDLE